MQAATLLYCLKSHYVNNNISISQLSTGYMQAILQILSRRENSKCSKCLGSSYKNSYIVCDHLIKLLLFNNTMMQKKLYCEIACHVVNEINLLSY